MEKIRKYILTVGVMLIVAFIMLFVVSILTYIFKWQADKVRIGIIITYVFAGFVGGYFSYKEERSGVTKMLLEAMTISFLFIFLLLIASMIIQQSVFYLSKQSLLIFALIVSSVYWGNFVRRNKKFRRLM